MKLIALTTLPGCHQKYLKVLKEGTTYYFNRLYRIDPDYRVVRNSFVLENLYTKAKKSENSMNRKLEININAIVGQNGSGKSSLMEILFRIINNVACRSRVSSNNELEYIPDVYAELTFKLHDYFRVRVEGDEVSLFKIDHVSGTLTVPMETEDFVEYGLFYTVVVNYSHYAYNTSDIGNWIDNLFHKNDGYRVPLVFNPFRRKGIIDINVENHLVKSRLISNFLLPGGGHFRDVTDNLTATRLRLTVAKDIRDKTVPILDKIGNVTDLTIDALRVDSDNLLELLGKHFSVSDVRIREADDLVKKYIVYKLISIAVKYPEYKNDHYFNHVDLDFDANKLEGYISRLSRDMSHVTLKLRQSILFMRFPTYKLEDQVLSLDILPRIITNIKRRTQGNYQEIAELVPPPFFQTDIILSPKNDLSKNIEFSDLSSGEKQQLYSISSFLYHLTNLASNHRRKSDGFQKKFYPDVLVVLEEIELYAHPEMQRKLVKYIIESFNRVPLTGIGSINLCFITHSPFILSDIYKQVILPLRKDGLPDYDTLDNGTFGANIHDILSDSFFMDSGSVGSFAQECIDNLILDIEKADEKSFSEAKHEEILKTIEIIGEPFLQMKLRDMYLQKIPNQIRIAALEAEIQKLKDDTTNKK